MEEDSKERSKTIGKMVMGSSLGQMVAGMKVAGKTEKSTVLEYLFPEITILE